MYASLADTKKYSTLKEDLKRDFGKANQQTINSYNSTIERRKESYSPSKKEAETIDNIFKYRKRQ